MLCAASPAAARPSTRRERPPTRTPGPSPPRRPWPGVDPKLTLHGPQVEPRSTPNGHQIEPTSNPNRPQSGPRRPKIDPRSTPRPIPRPTPRPARLLGPRFRSSCVSLLRACAKMRANSGSEGLPKSLVGLGADLGSILGLPGPRRKPCGVARPTPPRRRDGLVPPWEPCMDPQRACQGRSSQCVRQVIFSIAWTRRVIRVCAMFNSHCVQ